MFPLYALSVSMLIAVGLGALLYAVAGQGGTSAEGAPPPPSVNAGPEQLSARYREQMSLACEALRSLGYAPGPIGGTIGVETRSALRAFQSHHGLRVTGHATPETLTALGIEDRLARRSH